MFFISLEKKLFYKKKSTANIRLISLTGKPTDCKTITIVTNPADGIEAAPTDATVAVKLIIIYSTKVRCLSFICAIKIGATALKELIYN